MSTDGRPRNAAGVPVHPRVVATPPPRPPAALPRSPAARRRRRLLGGVALGVAGALLGAGLVAWQTRTSVFADAPCWDSVTGQDLDELLGGWDSEASEIRPQRAERGSGRLHGACLITSHDEKGSPGRQVDVRLHKLDGLKQYNIDWSEEFLSSRMTPMGEGLLGMASDTRAWVALPSSCSGRGTFAGPAVVDVSMGDDEIGNTENADRNATFQKALARTAVHVARGAMKELGCTKGSLPEPGELTAVPEFRPVGADRALCGVAGVRLPKNYVGSGAQMRVSAGGHSPVRTCDIVSAKYMRPQLRLQTIQEEDLTGALGKAAIDSGPSIKTTGPSEAGGAHSPSIALLRAKCDGREVMFIAQERKASRDYTFIREVFPAYVTAESKRLGCGPLQIRLPAS